MRFSMPKVELVKFDTVDVIAKTGSDSGFEEEES